MAPEKEVRYGFTEDGEPIITDLFIDHFDSFMQTVPVWDCMYAINVFYAHFRKTYGDDDKLTYKFAKYVKELEKFFGFIKTNYYQGDLIRWYREDYKKRIIFVERNKKSTTPNDNSIFKSKKRSDEKQRRKI